MDETVAWKVFLPQTVVAGKEMSGGLRSAALHSGPSHCLLRPRFRGNLYPTGPSPYTCAGGAQAPGHLLPKPPAIKIFKKQFCSIHFFVSL